MARAAEKGFLPELLQFSHPDESFWEARGQVTALELLTPKRPFGCAKQLQSEFWEGKAVLGKMCLWKNGMFQLLPDMFLMRRHLEKWNSSSSSQPSFSNGSGLLGRLLAGVVTVSPREQPHQASSASSSWPDGWCKASLAHPAVSLLHLSIHATLAEKGASCPIFFPSPDTSSKRPPHRSPPSLLHLCLSRRWIPAPCIPPWLFSPSQPSNRPAIP